MKNDGYTKVLIVSPDNIRGPAMMDSMSNGVIRLGVGGVYICSAMIYDGDSSSPVYTKICKITADIISRNGSVPKETIKYLDHISHEDIDLVLVPDHKTADMVWKYCNLLGEKTITAGDFAMGSDSLEPGAEIHEPDHYQASVEESLRTDRSGHMLMFDDINIVFGGVADRIAMEKGYKQD